MKGRKRTADTSNGDRDGEFYEQPGKDIAEQTPREVTAGTKK